MSSPTHVYSDCSPGIEFSVSRIGKFVISGLDLRIGCHFDISNIQGVAIKVAP